MTVNRSFALFLICIVCVSRESIAAGSSCEGDDCFIEEQSSRRNARKEIDPPQPNGGQASSKLVHPPSDQKGAKRVKTETVKKTSKRADLRAQLITATSVSQGLSSNGNIPTFMMRRDAENGQYSVGPLVVNSKEMIEKISGVRDGDVLYASLPQKLKATPQAPTSIKVTVLSGEKRGSFLMGSATLDPELKRVFLTFNKFRDRDDDEIYTIDGEGQNLDGERGIEGEYHTEEGKFFLASLVTGFLGVLADSSVTRNQTVNGTWTQEPSLANGALTSAGATLVQQGGRLAQKADSAPQYTQTEGNQMIRVMLKSDAIRKL